MRPGDSRAPRATVLSIEQGMRVDACVRVRVCADIVLSRISDSVGSAWISLMDSEKYLPNFEKERKKGKRPGREDRES